MTPASGPAGTGGAGSKGFGGWGHVDDISDEGSVIVASKALPAGAFVLFAAVQVTGRGSSSDEIADVGLRAEAWHRAAE